MKNLILILLFGLLFFGCISQTTTTDTNNNQDEVVEELEAQAGDFVSVDYIGTLDDNSTFDQGFNLEFNVGAGQMITGFDNAVVGMKEGDEKTVTIPPEEAYGLQNSELIVPFNRSGEGVPQDIWVGMIVFNAEGNPGEIVELYDDVFVVDFNHRLAGKNLTFKITMRNIERN